MITSRISLIKTASAEQMSDNKVAPCMFTFYMQGRILIARRPAPDRIQAVFVTVYSVANRQWAEAKRKGAGKM